jgi:hypothetical protein
MIPPALLLRCCYYHKTVGTGLQFVDVVPVIDNE